MCFDYGNVCRFTDQASLLGYFSGFTASFAECFNGIAIANVYTSVHGDMLRHCNGYLLLLLFFFFFWSWKAQIPYLSRKKKRGYACQENYMRLIGCMPQLSFINFFTLSYFICTETIHNLCSYMLSWKDKRLRRIP